MAENGTTFEFTRGQAEAGDVLIAALPMKPAPLELVARVDKHCDGAVSALTAAKAVPEELGSLAHTTSRGAFRRVLVVSLGDSAKLDADKLRRAAAAAARWLVSQKLRSAALWFDGLAALALDQPAAEWAGGMMLAGFRFTAYKSEPDKAPARIRINLIADDANRAGLALRDIRETTALIDAVNYARGLAHEPPNAINPETLAEQAQRLARKFRLRCTVLTPDRIKRMGMGGLLAVGGGALHGPRLIVLEYRGAPRAKAVNAIVGKAVTFDTGGYSIKPAANMEDMKFDKSGGMTVLGVLRAAAALKLNCNVTGIIAAAENAVSDRAYRPADILHMASGKTVEITNTDAEGRLVLADALWYAQEHANATAIIDLATLTGGVRVALGAACAGLMSNDDKLAADLEECGQKTHERLWRLPLWSDYRELITSTEADIKNASNKRDAHPIVGGMFLKEFVKERVPWAHLDIAAVAGSEDAKSPVGKGSAGFGVRLLIEYLRRQQR
ncbi:Cytosol aminopeptidase [Phycisphaerae bacterium RAS1]|nr:Cytosol aminopeptidase [Phycisphaerae bacterium RAS1]